MTEWRGPALTLFHEHDGRNAKNFQRQVPGAAGQPHQLLPDCSFFLLEDHPVALAEAAAAFVCE